VTPGPFRLSVAQAAWIVFYLTLCVTPFSFAEVMIQTMGRWAWAGVVPGASLGLLALGAVAVLRHRLPRSSVLDYAPQLLGRFAGWLYIALLGLLFASGAGANLRVFVDMLHSTLNSSMSGWVPALVMTVLTAYVAFFGPEVIARVATALLLAVVPGIALITTLPWLNSVPGRLWPFWTVPWADLTRQAHTASAIGVCRGFLPLLVLAPVIQGDRFFRRTAAAQVAASLLIMVAFAIPVAVFGPHFAAQFRFPLLDAAGTVSWSWLPIQRLGHLTVLFWQMITFIVAATYLWLGAAVGGWLFLHGRWRPLIPVLGVVTLLISGPLIGPQLQKTVLTVWNWGVVALGMAVPIALALAVLPRRSAA